MGDSSGSSARPPRTSGAPRTATGRSSVASVASVARVESVASSSGYGAFVPSGASEARPSTTFGSGAEAFRDAWTSTSGSGEGSRSPRATSNSSPADASCVSTSVATNKPAANAASVFDGIAPSRASLSLLLPRKRVR